MTKRRTLCATDLARDLGRGVGRVMAASGVPDSPKGRKVAVLTMLSVAAVMLEGDEDRALALAFFKYANDKDEAPKQAIISKMLGADVVREEHTHFVVDFESEPEPST